MPLLSRIQALLVAVPCAMVRLPGTLLMEVMRMKRTLKGHRVIENEREREGESSGMMLIGMSSRPWGSID